MIHHYETQDYNALVSVAKTNKDHSLVLKLYKLHFY